MQKWEYCTVGPITTFCWRDSEGRDHDFPSANKRSTLSHMLTTGMKLSLIEAGGNCLAKTMAQLGADGWELVGCGSSGGPPLQNTHYLYFKRPTQE